MCTLIGRATDGAGTAPFVASTSDNPNIVRSRLVVGEGSDATRFIGTVVEGDPAAIAWDRVLTRGVSSNGLALTYSSVEPLGEAPRADDDPVRFTERLLLSCASIDDALDFLGAGAPRGLTGNYLLADARGELAAVEVSYQSASVSRPAADVRTNRWLAATMPRARASAYSGESSDIRRSRGLALLERATSSAAIVRLLSDHEGRRSDERPYGHSVCNHGSEEGTISAEILWPRARAIDYRYGRPCGERDAGIDSWGSFRRFRLDDLPPGPVTGVDGQLLVGHASAA